MSRLPVRRYLHHAREKFTPTRTGSALPTEDEKIELAREYADLMSLHLSELPQAAAFNATTRAAPRLRRKSAAAHRR